MLKPGFHNVNVMRSAPVLIALDEPGIERRRILSPCRPPEIVIALRFQDGNDFLSGFIEARHLNQHIHDRFGRKAGDGGTAEVLDSADKIPGKTRQKMDTLFLVHFRPAGIVCRNGNFLADDAGNLLFKGFHFLSFG
ncbi:MAG: hypothetical protein A4E66_01746 [Syntrophus sp. PtaB.Bin001]|nr:MAG: hypothetical protein A4E66_01746 [Syntrophus sp. PtaB.Bin001]